MEILKNYKAKLDGQSIYDHNQDMINLLNQLDMGDSEREKMVKIIKLHDIGKVVSSFQDNIESKHREIRHEILSASIKDLDDYERIAILTHHKNIEYFDDFILDMDEDNPYNILETYERELKELTERTGLDTINIMNFIYKLRVNKIREDLEAIYLKGYLNSCDHLASAGFKRLERGFNVENHIELNFDTLTSVQEKMKKETDDVLIISPTGSGKTEASLYWASNIESNKVFYVLPYTASINAMYKRLKGLGMSVGMSHYKLNDYLFSNLTRDYTDIKEKQQEYKYFTKEINITTIHQISKALFNCKFNEMLLTTIKNSCIILDEIHCFDERELAIIIQSLKYFKENLNVRVCIMSASIPSRLKDLIKSELNIEKIITMTEEEKSKIKRHTVKYVDKTIEFSTEKILKDYKEGKNVLICCNTVSKAQEMYRKIRDNLVGRCEDILLIHSAFNQRDRNKKEKKVLTKSNRILIGTQVLEVSLDIDYDVLYTELSSIDSQIQRWGRVNRKRLENLKELKEIYVYENSEGDVIYIKEFLERTKELLKKLNNVDENRVQEYLDYVYQENFKDYDKYKDIMKSITEDIKLGVWDKNKTFESYDTYSVVPLVLEDEYRELIYRKRYTEAGALTLNISRKKYYYAIKDKAIVEEDGYTVITYKYNEKEGLLYKEKDIIF